MLVSSGCRLRRPQVFEFCHISRIIALLSIFPFKPRFEICFTEALKAFLKEFAGPEGKDAQVPNLRCAELVVTLRLLDSKSVRSIPKFQCSCDSWQVFLVNEVTVPFAVEITPFKQKFLSCALANLGGDGAEAPCIFEAL